MKKCMIECGLGKIMALWICVWGLLVCTSSCDSDRVNADGIGMLRLSLSADTTSLNKGIGNPTKAAVSDEFETFLTTADYTIRIVQQSDTVQSYDRFDEMPSEVELKEGAYTLIASKGDNLPSAFENPYFEGSADFTVKAGMSTPIDVTCTLGNARITVDYTEDFKEAYSDYTVLLSSAFTSGSLEIKKGETRPAYMQVAKEGSELGVAIRLKKITEDKEKTYKIPTPLSIERRQNIRLIFKTDGEALDGIGLEIILDDEMTNVTLNEGIPDFMWKPFTEPTLNVLSFGDGSFSIHPGGLEEEPSVIFQAPAGVGGFYIDVWKGDGIEMEEADEVVQYDLATAEGAASAKEAGYSWNLPDETLSGVRKKGQVYLQKAINNLEPPVNQDPFVYNIRIYAKDRLAKANYTDTLFLKVTVKEAGSPMITFPQLPPVIEGDAQTEDVTVVISAESGIDKAETKITITPSNGEAKVYTFSDETAVRDMNTLGIEVKEESNKKINLIFHKSFSQRLDAGESGVTYHYQVDLKENGSSQRSDTKSQELEVKAPVLSLETTDGDAFAKRIVLRAAMQVGHKEKLYFQYQKVGDGDDNWRNVTANLKEEGLVNYIDTVKGLAESTKDVSSKYRVRAVYRGAKEWITEAKEVTMEIPGVLPNADFEAWSIAPDENGSADEAATNSINVGGRTEPPYRYWEVWQPWDDATENKGWNTLNLKTTQDGATEDGFVQFISISGGYPWTRYTANSGTIRSEGADSPYAALVRTVGWGNGSSAAGESSADVIKHISAGELYLGSCLDLNPVYGIDFSSRPTGFTFQYKYLTKDGSDDKFVAEIVVVASDNSIVAKAQLPNAQSGPKSDWTTANVYLKYNGGIGRLKASKMYIRFKSSTSDDYDFLRSNLMVYPPFSNLSNGEYVGSQLYIDNVKLIYE